MSASNNMSVSTSNNGFGSPFLFGIPCTILWLCVRKEWHKIVRVKGELSVQQILCFNKNMVRVKMLWMYE